MVYKLVFAAIFPGDYIVNQPNSGHLCGKLSNSFRKKRIVENTCDVGRKFNSFLIFLQIHLSVSLSTTIKIVCRNPLTLLLISLKGNFKTTHLKHFPN